MKELLMAIARFLGFIKVSPNSVPADRSDHFTGILPDNRTQDQKNKDYLHEEVQPVRAVDPFGNHQITESPYPIEDQYGTSSCVSHGVGLAFSIARAAITGYYQRLAWLFHYRLRSNYPNEGYIIPEGFQNYATYGAPVYESAPDVLSESDANQLVITPQMRTDAKVFEGLEYYMISGIKDITTLATIAANGMGVAISIFATFNEWASQYPTIEIPDLTPGDPRAVVNHEICILPMSGFIHNNTKYVAIQDSAHFGGYSLRYLSEDFIAKRVTTAGYWKSVNLLGGGIAPKFTFTRSLTVGDTGADVKAFQQLLVSENCLPADCTTGYFGGRTLAGLHAFQDKYAQEILTPIGLSAPTNTFGPRTIKKANQLCA